MPELRQADYLRPVTSDVATATALLQGLVGKALSQLCVGVGDVQLRFDDGQSVQLESTITVGDTVPVEPYNLGGLARLLPLLNAELTAVSVDETGLLTLTIGATNIRCEADERYEAWNYNGPEGLLVVALPGSKLSIWSNR